MFVLNSKKMCIKLKMDIIRNTSLSLIVFLFLLTNTAFAKNLDKIKIIGNERISDETIIMFSSVSKIQNLKEVDLNNIIKNLYETNYFESIKTKIENNVLIIEVKENKVIGNISYDGVKAKNIRST